MSDNNTDVVSLHECAQNLIFAIEELLNATEAAKDAVLSGNEVEAFFGCAEECAVSAKLAFESLERQQLFPEGLSAIMRDKLQDSVQRWYFVMQDLSSLAKSQMDEAEKMIYNAQNRKGSLDDDSGVILNDSV